MSAAVVLAMGVGIGIGAWVAPGNPVATARHLLSTSIAAAKRAGSFHYAERSVTNGVTDDIVGDAASHGGRQTITQGGPTGIDRFDLRLVNGVVYFSGNEAAVVDQLKVPAATAAGVVHRWVSVRSGAAVYHTFEVGITTSSNLSQLPSIFVPRSSAGVAGSSPATTRIAGGLSTATAKAPVGTARLTIDTTTSLPKSFSANAKDATSGATVTLSWSFSHWGEKVAVSVPTGAVPYSSLHAG